MWKKREVVLAGGGDEFEEEEESTLVSGSPKPTELGDISKQAGPEARVEKTVCDARSKEAVEPIVSQEDITAD